MSRPINADAAATRQRILRCSTELFAQHGLDGTSVRDLSKACGVSVATINHYFQSKEALFEACVAGVYVPLTAMASELAGLLGGAEDVREVLRRAVVTMYRFGRTEQTVLRLLVRTSIFEGGTPRSGRTLMLEHFLPLVSETLAVKLGRPSGALHLPLQTMIFLTARYALQGRGELAAIERCDEGEVDGRVEAHLVEAAHRLLLPS